MKDAVGSVLFNAMTEGSAVPDLGVVHPSLLTNRDESSDSRDRLQEQLQQVYKMRWMGVMIILLTSEILRGASTKH